MRDLASIASALGGKVTGQGVFAPGPNNSHLAVFLDSTNADGVRVSPEQYTYYVLSKVGSNGATKAAVANVVKMRTKSKTAPAEIDPQQIPRLGTAHRVRRVNGRYAIGFRSDR
jgi:hypothetical protein